MNYNEKPNDPLFIEDILTPLTEEEFTYYLREGFKAALGYYPPISCLSVLWAHAALEVGRGKQIHSNNWGNTKKQTGVKYTSYACSEILNGKNQHFVPYHPQTFFSSYATPLEGATAYINFLKNRKRYQAAWNQIIFGNPAEYSHQLKLAGYYTADEEGYTTSVIKLCNEFKAKAQKLMAWSPPKPQLVKTITPPPLSATPTPIPPPPKLPFMDIPKSDIPESEIVPLPPQQNSFIKLIMIILQMLIGLVGRAKSKQ